MESQKRGKGRPKHIEKGANHNFWMPDDLWESIPKTKEKSKTTFICEAIVEKQKREELKEKQPENQEFIKHLVSLGLATEGELYESIKSYIVKSEQNIGIMRMYFYAIEEKVKTMSNSINQ